MGLVFDSVEGYETALDKALQAAMVNDVADRAKLIISDVIDEVVYKSYPLPRFEDRTGALKSTGNMLAYYSGNELTIENIAQWNWSGFFYIDGRGTRGELADVIRKNQIYHAPARDFVPLAESRLSMNTLDKTVEGTLRSMGF